MEIITGDSIPKGFVIMQRGYFNKEEVGTSLEALTKKQVKKMKTYGKWRHCCKIFIAFKPIESFKNNTPGPDFWKTKVSFYVLAPFWDIDL